MYLGKFTFSIVTKKCKNTLCSNDNWYTPPALGRKHSCMSFCSTLCSFCISLHFPLALPLHRESLTIPFYSIVTLFIFSSIDPSTSLLQALAMTSSVIVTGIPMMFERISVSVKGFRPSSSLVFPPRLGSIRTFSCSLSLTTFWS